MIESCAALGVGCGRSPDLAVSAALSRGGVRLLLAALHFSEFGPFPPLPTEEALAQGRSRAQLSDVAAAAIVPLLKGAGATETGADISGAKAVVAQLRSGYGIEACCSVLSRSLYSLSTPKSFPGTVVSSAQYSQPRCERGRLPMRLLPYSHRCSTTIDPFPASGRKSPSRAARSTCWRT